MTHRLQFAAFRSPADSGWAEAMTIYREAFPPRERRSEEDTVAALADPAFRAESIRVDRQVAGILFYWLFGASYYVEYLAVSPALRGQNIGAEALAEFCRGRRVILEIEPPEDPLAVRRKHFYERAGFVANPHAYIHPSYGCPNEPHPLVLMSFPDPLTNDEARGFADFVREKVLRYSQLERPGYK